MNPKKADTTTEMSEHTEKEWLAGRGSSCRLSGGHVVTHPSQVVCWAGSRVVTSSSGLIRSSPLRLENASYLMKHSLWIRILLLLFAVAVSASAALGPRQVEAGSGYSFQPPAGWNVIRLPGLPFLTVAGPPADEGVPGMTIQKDEEGRSLAAVLAAKRQEVTGDGQSVVLDTAFTTTSRLAGRRLVTTQGTGSDAMRWNYFVLPGAGTAVFLVECTAYAASAAALDATFLESAMSWEVIGAEKTPPVLAVVTEEPPAAAPKPAPDRPQKPIEPDAPKAEPAPKVGDPASRPALVGPVTEGQLRPGTVGVGLNHSLALAGNGSVWIWSTPNRSGLVRVEPAGGAEAARVPAPVPSMEKVTQIAAGEVHSLALKEDGSVWSWGNNLSGQVGAGGFVVLSPVQPLAQFGEKYAFVAAGWGHSMAVSREGTLRVWGDNNYGQRGMNGFTEVTQVAGGQGHVVALRRDGTVWTVGMNDQGQVADGSYRNRSVPHQVPGLPKIQAVAAGKKNSMALGVDGSVWRWGRHERKANPAAGEGTEWNGFFYTNAVAMRLPGPAVAIATGGDHCLVLLKDGTLWGWGDSWLMDRRSSGNTSEPVPLSQLDGVVAIAASASHSLARRKDGSVWIWGSEDWPPSSNEQFVPLKRVADLNLDAEMPMPGLKGPVAVVKAARKVFPDSSPAAGVLTFADAQFRGDYVAAAECFNPKTFFSDKSLFETGEPSAEEFEKNKEAGRRMGIPEAALVNPRSATVAIMHKAMFENPRATQFGNFSEPEVREPVMNGTDHATVEVVWKHPRLTLLANYQVDRIEGRWRIQKFIMPTPVANP